MSAILFQRVRKETPHYSKPGNRATEWIKAHAGNGGVQRLDKINRINRIDRILISRLKI